MKRNDAPMTHSRWICGCLLALLLASVPLAAQTEPAVAKLENTGGKIIVRPVIEEFLQINFTVTGPCNYVYREVIEPGGIGVFRTSEETIDAIYRLQLVAIPKVDGEILEILDKARQLDDNTEVNALCREGALPGDPLNQSLGFRILRGEIMWDPDKVEDRGRIADPAPTGFGDKGIPLKDFVINDDLIVDGSACIGFDCVDGESFGFDTIRVKENNLRIKFDDTSVAASYPRNDWQLTANDSANGGASKFSIDDISGNRTPFTVEANARSHSLYVDDGGRIGSRTSTPSTEIHTIDGDTPTLRLQQDGSSGFAPQTWDVAGNETNFFIRDVTNGSTLPLRIRPGAPTSSIFIDVDGDVGLGTSSPDAALDLEASGPGFRLTNTGAGGSFWDVTVNAVQGRLNFQVDGGNIPLKMDNGADNNLVQVGQVASNQVDINGNLAVDGDITATGTITPDYVFEPDFDLESIEEHAAFMWSKKHLPAVAPGKVNTEGKGVINLTARAQGVLEELEKAHIYIERLNTSVNDKNDEIVDLKQRLALIEALVLQQAD